MDYKTKTMISFKGWISNFRICSLILMLNLLIMAIVIPSVICVWQINSIMLNQYFQESTNIIFTNQSRRSLTSITHAYVQQTWEFLNKTQRELARISYLYQASLDYNYIGNVNPDMCHTELTDEDVHYYYNQLGYCINIYDTTFQEYDELVEINTFQTEYNYITMLNEYLMQFDPSQQFLPTNFYVTFLFREFTGWEPQWDRIADYHPTQRSWYKQHIELSSQYKNLDCFVTDLYQYYADYPFLGMTITCNLKNTSKELIGISASDTYFQSQYYSHSKLNLMIVNNDGLLVMSTYQNQIMGNSTEVAYFFDQNITGFSLDDWNQIQQYVNNSSFTSNCRIIPNYKNNLCRYNSILDQDIIMSVQNVSNPNFLFIIFFNLTDDLIDFEYQRNIVRRIDDEFISMLLIFIFISCGAILSQLIVIWIIFIPLNDLIKHSKSYLKRDSQSLLFNLRQSQYTHFDKDYQINNNILFTLRYSYKQIYHRLNQQSFKKCPQCQDLQRFTYPHSSHLNISFPKITTNQINLQADKKTEAWIKKLFVTFYQVIKL